jgi:hypothetical protein
MDYDDDDELDNEVNDIISQIKNQSKNFKKEEIEIPELNRENLEELLLRTAAKVITHSVEVMEKMKDDVIASADSKMLESYSAHTKATTSALETLLKFKNAEDKIKAQKEIAQMNIDSKITKGDDDDGTPKLTFTRNDILKLLEKKKDDDDDAPPAVPVTVDV